MTIRKKITIGLRRRETKKDTSNNSKCWRRKWLQERLRFYNRNFNTESKFWNSCGRLVKRNGIKCRSLRLSVLKYDIWIMVYHFRDNEVIDSWMMLTNKFKPDGILVRRKILSEEKCKCFLFSGLHLIWTCLTKPTINDLVVMRIIYQHTNIIFKIIF